MTGFVVVLLGKPTAGWGPFDDQTLAEQFAQWVTENIDPAEVVSLRDPTREMITLYRTEQQHARNLPGL